MRWDDGVYSTVRQLVIAHGIGIDSILIEYDKNGSSVWSEKHGGSGGTRTNRVGLRIWLSFAIYFHHKSSIITEVAKL